LLNPKLATIKVQVLPAKRQQLAPTHPGGNGHGGDDVEEPASQSIQDNLDIIRPENVDFRRGHAGRIDEFGHVLLDYSPFARVTESTMHHAVRVADRAGGKPGFPQQLSVKLIKMHGPQLLFGCCRCERTRACGLAHCNALEFLGSRSRRPSPVPIATGTQQGSA
jgi:hypothetical protein